MKKLVAGTLTAALAALLSYASPMFAGSFTVATGPTFTPDTAFTNNTIAIDATTGAELIRVNGGATITPDATNQAMISLMAVIRRTPATSFRQHIVSSSI